MFHQCLKQVIYVTSPDNKTQYISDYHLGKNNHRGINETSEHLKRMYYWKGIDKDIQNFINNCDICKREKYNRNPCKAPLQLTPTFDNPFQCLNIDIFQINKTKYLTIIDSFSKFTQAYLLNSHNKIDLVNSILKYFANYAVPKKIIADNEFDNVIIKEFMKLHNIELHITTPLHHESNSLIERVHSTLIEHFRLLESTPEKDRMIYCILAYNNSIHSNLKYTPREILFGHTDNQNPYELCTEGFYGTYVNDHKQRMAQFYDDLKIKQVTTKQERNNKINTDKQIITFNIDQKVFLKNDRRDKKSPKFKGPFKIIKILDNNRYLLKHPQTSKTFERHYNELLIVTGPISSSLSPGLSS